MKRKTLLINYEGFGVATGGIELYIKRVVKALKTENENNRVIFILNKNVKGRINDIYKDVISSSEVVFIKDSRLFMYCDKMNFEPNEEVLALSFYQLPYMRLEYLKRKYPHAIFHHILWVPHYDPQFVFLEAENWVPRIVRKKIYNLVREDIIKMDANNNICYLHSIHRKAFEDNYDYKTSDPDNNVLKCSTRTIRDFDQQDVIRRYNLDEFNIISVGRFEFPHKGYILGLIDKYAILKDKYPQITLTIVGDGAHKNELMDKINRLPEYKKKDIELTGVLVDEDLEKYYKKSKLNVGVAGAISQASGYGILSIVARSYSNTCECYGFFDENTRKKTLSTEKGLDIEEFIEKAINSSLNEYLELSKASYNVTTSNKCKYNPLEIMEKEVYNTGCIVDNKKMKFYICYYLCKQIYIRTINRCRNVIKRLKDKYEVKRYE